MRVRIEFLEYVRRVAYVEVNSTEDAHRLWCDDDEFREAVASVSDERDGGLDLVDITEVNE